MRGGYQIIKLNNINITSTSTKIDGIYENIESTYYKAILLSEIVLNGVEKNEVFVTVNSSTNLYTINLYDGILTVDNDDNVKFEASTTASLTKKEEQ